MVLEAVADSKGSMVAVVAEAVEALVVMGSWGSKVVVEVVNTRRSKHSADHHTGLLSEYTKPTTHAHRKTCCTNTLCP